MSRSRRTAREQGTRWESCMRDYLAWALNDPRIIRPRLHGARDIGDIANVYWHGQPVAIECKWTAHLNANKHLREAEIEAGNLDSPYPWVLQHRDHVGLTRKTVGNHWAYTRSHVLEAMVRKEETWATYLLEETITLPGRPKPDIVCITTEQFALLLNHGLPLGKEREQA